MIHYSIDVLAALKEAGYTQTFLRKENILSGRSVDNLRSGKPTTWETLNVLCELLRCQPGDILEWTPGD